MYVDRTYRETFSAKDLVPFRVVIKDSDMMILVDKESYVPELPKKAEQITRFYRTQLEDYIMRDPIFKTTLEPHLAYEDAPPIALEMVKAGNSCGVGPMAAVAGAMAELVGRALLKKVKEVIVENGGDLFLCIKKPRIVGIFAGQSPFSDKLALKVYPGESPLGLCTSSGTVGPSLSFGKADAVVIAAPSAALADAAATAVGNLIQTKDDVVKGVEAAKRIKGVTGVLVIKDDRLSAWGDIEIVPRA